MKTINPTSDLKNKGHQLEVSMARFIRTKQMIETNMEISISDIIDIDDVKDLMSSFYEMTGLGIGIFDNTNRLLVSAGWQKICTHFHRKHPESSKGCAESGRYFRNNLHPNKAMSYKCSNGLWEMAYPIYVDDDYLGSIYFGQYFYNTEEIDKEFFLNQAEKFKFDKEEYINFLKEVPILSEARLDSYVKFFIKVIEKIAKIGKL